MCRYNRQMIRKRLILAGITAVVAIAAAAPWAWSEVVNYRYRVHKAAGMEALHAKDFKTATTEFTIASELLPDNPGAFLWLGWTQVQQGNHADGEALLLKGIDLDANCYLCAFKIGTSRMQKHDFAAAADWYGKALAIQPTWPLGHYHHARALAAAGRTDDAIAAAKTALSQDPKTELATKLLQQLESRKASQAAPVSTGVRSPAATPNL